LEKSVWTLYGSTIRIGAITEIDFSKRWRFVAVDWKYDFAFDLAEREKWSFRGEEYFEKSGIE